MKRLTSHFVALEKSRILLLLALIGSNVFGKAKPGLEVGFTYRDVMVVVEDPGKDAGKRGLTRKGIERTVEEQLLKGGLRQVEKSPSGSYLYVNINELAPAFNVSVTLRKYPGHYGIPLEGGIGLVFTPGFQGDYTTIGKYGGRDPKYILLALKEVLGRFIVDYLESNLRYEATLKDKKLRGVDRAIYGAIKMVQPESEAETVFWPSTSAHTQWWLRYYKLTGNQANTHPTAIPGK